MSRPTYGSSYSGGGDGFYSFLSSVAGFLMWAGFLVLAVGSGFLVYYVMAFGAGQGPGEVETALRNAEIFRNLAIAGALAVMVGTTFLFWGEETLGVLQLIGAGLFFFAPMYLPMMLTGGQAPGEVAQAALRALQLVGTVGGVVAILVLVADIGQRVQTRTKFGTKADQLKYGKGIKEEQDYQNVFLGKCWQLPFCRKFVREKCPIFHSKRTCWRERVGCMCEEQVIRNALEGKPIPANPDAAARVIPYNNMLTMAQKQERCRQCVIYNEHQKHKYKLVLPLVLGAFILVYALFRAPLVGVAEGFLASLDRVIGRATFRETDIVAGTVARSGIPFQEILLVCVMVIALAYTIKLVEFLIFKLKI